MVTFKTSARPGELSVVKEMAKTLAQIELHEGIELSERG